MTILAKSSPTYLALKSNLRKVIQNSLKRFKPPEQIGSLAWGLKYRRMSEEQTRLAGRYSDKLTPWAKFMLAAMDDPKVRRVVVVKSAQIGWTDGIWNTFLGRIIHTAPCNIFMLFAKKEAYDKYFDKKFNPSIRATPVLRELINVDAVRSHGSRSGFKKFPGGSITAAGANSPSNIKSDSVSIGCVEEPDDCTSNVKGQGDSVFMLEERLKTDPNSKLIEGGTPTIEGLSRILADYKQTDQRKLYVPCHDCGEGHVLSWENVVWDDDPDRNDEIYGKAVIESAVYCCPHCGSIWDDRQKGLNVQNLYEVIEKPEITEDVGFYINELYSLFSGSELATLVKKYLKAEYALKLGDDSKMIGFMNNTLAQGYVYKGDGATADEIRDKGEDYPELIVPRHASELLVTVDVQRDRIAIIIRAYGKGMESWLVYFGEIWAKNSINDVNDPVWTELDKVIFGSYRHETGAIVKVIAAEIDTSDGVTQAATYGYVRSRQGRGVKVLAIKGADSYDAPIVTLPKKIDLNAQKTKADKFGLKLWRVGTQLAKDQISARLKLEGDGPNRMHHYRTVRADYPDQMTGEIKAPKGGRLVWQQKSGVNIEAWDCETYNYHLALVEKLHLKKPDWWDARLAALMQVDLLGDSAPDDLVTAIDIRPDFEEAAVSEAGDSGEQVVVQVKPVSQPSVQANNSSEPSLEELGRMLNS